MDEPLVIFPVTIFKALLGQIQFSFCIVKAFQLLQAEVTPHYVQLENRVVINRVQEFSATLTGRETEVASLRGTRNRQPVNHSISLELWCHSHHGDARV